MINLNFKFLKKENKYLKKGCKFIIHTPMPEIAGK